MRSHTFACAALAVVLLSGCAAEATPTVSPSASVPVTSTAAIEMPAIPMVWQVPKALAPRLSITPLTESDGEFAASIFAAGGTSAATVRYAPLTGAESSILMTVFWFPKEAFVAAQNPDEPPLFGQAVVETDGYVLAVAGPSDAMYEGEDGVAVTTLYDVMYDASHWSTSKQS